MTESAVGLARRRSALLIVLLVLLGVGLFALGVVSASYFAPKPAPVAAIAEADFATPTFVDPEAKLIELSDSAFTRKLLDESAALEPALEASGTQVHMGFYSGPGNHGNLARLLDAINGYKSTDGVVHKAIWDEGVTTSLQIPSYVSMNREAWYERAYPTTDGAVVVYGVPRSNITTIPPAKADEIWGQYSRRYADQATAIRAATGKPVEVWCFVQGAKANRIFYTNEFVELKRLEAEGVVNLHFAKTADADWQNPDDWTHGTANAPPALP